MVRQIAVSSLAIMLTSMGLLTGCRDHQEKAVAVLHDKQLIFDTETFLVTIRNKDVTGVQAYLDAGMSPDGKSADGRTPLCQACEVGDTAIAKLLINSGANVNLAQADGQLPVILAARHTDSLLVELLISKGVMLDGKNLQNRTALAEAVLQQNLTTLKPLCKASPTRSLDYALQLAAVLGNLAMIDLLLVNGADANARSSEYQTPLMYAAAGGHEQAVKVLMERGAQRLALNNQHRTAADLALANGFQSIADTLNEPTVAVGGDSAWKSKPSEPLHTMKFPEPISGLKLAHYEQETLPYMVVEVRPDGKTALVEDLRQRDELLEVEAGVLLPGTHFEVVGFTKKRKNSKSASGALIDVSTMTLTNKKTSERVLAQLGIPIETAEHRAFVLHGPSAKLYVATKGNLFKVGEAQWRVVDLRPTQLLVENTETLATAVIEK